MNIAVIVLAVSSFGFSFAGVFRGALALRREHKHLTAALTDVQRIARDSGTPPSERDERLRATLIPSSNWTDVLYMREYVRAAVIAQAYENLKYPALLVLSGALMGMAGDILGAIR